MQKDHPTSTRGNNENPFKVPENYFENLSDRVMERIEQKEPGISAQTIKTVRIRPLLSLAATISGLALVIYVVLQTITGNQSQGNGYTDLAVLEEAGIVMDEYALAETYVLSDEESLSTWDEEAMMYLASNEVDLLHLLESN